MATDTNSTDKEYLLDVYQNNPDLFPAIAEATILKYIGIHPDTGGGGCSPKNCFGTTGCTQGSINGECECVGGQCVWIPAIG